jgi:hypothetical protein
MLMLVNISGVAVNSSEPKPEGRIFQGTDSWELPTYQV